jgi:recombination protein RecT
MSTAVRESVSTAVTHVSAAALTQAKSQELAAFVTPAAQAVIAPLLKRGVTYDRVLTEVYLAVRKNPQLQECTGESMLESVARCLVWDLVIGETVHLVPFSVKVKGVNGQRDTWESRAQAIRDYKGDIELVVRSGAARYVDAQCVYKNELFEYEQGSDPFIKHRPILHVDSRGPLIGAYAVAKISSRDLRIVWMSVEEIDAIRLKLSKQWKEEWVDGKKVPITLDKIPWYAKKTVIHQVTKTLPKTPALQAALKQFADEDAELDREEALDPTRRIEAPTPIEGTSTVVAAPPEPPIAATQPVEQAAPTPTRTLAWARALKLPFKNSDARGTPIGEIQLDGLTALAVWIRGKQAQRGPEWEEETLAAIELVISDLETAAAQRRRAPRMTTFLR